jgi:uncharacterized protein (DUF983 family)
MSDLAGSRRFQAPASLRWQDLASSGDGLASDCPFCKEGVLPMMRDTKLRLLAIDSCTLCGQAVVYSDIDEVRTQDYGG